MTNKPSLALRTYNSNTQEAKVKILLQSPPDLHSVFKTSLGYLRFCIKNKYSKEIIFDEANNV